MLMSLRWVSNFHAFSGSLFPSSPYIEEGAFFLVNSLKMFNNTQKMIWEEKTRMIYTTDGSLKCILIEKKEACYLEHGNLSRSMPFIQAQTHFQAFS